MPCPAITRLVGHRPTISSPRPCQDADHGRKRNHEVVRQMSGGVSAPERREPTWLERVRDIFDFDNPKGWRHNAPFHRDPLERMGEFELVGVDRGSLKL